MYYLAHKRLEKHEASSRSPGGAGGFSRGTVTCIAGKALRHVPHQASKQGAAGIHVAVG